MPAIRSSAAPTAPGGARSRIVGAARRHFLAHGFRGVTLDELAAELGMSKKTFYAHFAGKTALVQAVLAQKMQEVEADLEGITARPGPSFASAVRELLVCFQRHTAEIQPPFIRDVRRDAPEVFRFIEQRRTALIERHFHRLLARGRRSGMIRRDVPLHLIIEILLAATQAIMNPARMEQLGLTPATGYPAIIKVVLEGAMTPPGKQRP